MYQEIIEFWFKEIDSSKWWAKDEEFDNLIRQRFSTIHSQAVKCELFAWRSTPLGALAEIIVLDQFSRNMFRDRPQSFAYDSLALVLSQTAIAKNQDKDLELKMRSFMYMPFMHSESLLIHDQAINLFTELGSDSQLNFEKRHRHIIEKFGRYPHRNQILGRVSSLEEKEFLNQPGSSF